MIPPAERPDPDCVLTLCPTCGVCPECLGARACRHCGVRSEELDDTGHCEGCCAGTFVPRSAHVDLDTLADARWSALGTEVEVEASPLATVPWERWPGDLEAVA